MRAVLVLRPTSAASSKRVRPCPEHETPAAARVSSFLLPGKAFLRRDSWGGSAASTKRGTYGLSSSIFNRVEQRLMTNEARQIVAGRSPYEWIGSPGRPASMPRGRSSLQGREKALTGRHTPSGCVLPSQKSLPEPRSELPARSVSMCPSSSRLDRRRRRWHCHSAEQIELLRSRDTIFPSKRPARRSLPQSLSDPKTEWRVSRRSRSTCAREPQRRPFDSRPEP